MLNDSSADENPVEALAAEFAERRRRGEHPSIEEYVARHPELADEIRAFFPALALVEELKPGSDDATDSFAGAASLGDGSPRERLGDFRLLREIGRGGMGVVYEAEQESLGRRVALKVLGTSTLLDPLRLRRFHREARAAANLHHTNIVPVFGVGEEEGLHYYVMQFIPGLSLDEVLEELRRLRTRKDLSRAGGATGSRAHEVSAADVAQSLWTGQFPPIATDSPTEDEPLGPTASARGDAPEDSSSSVALPGEADLSSVTDSSRRYFKSVARIGEQVADSLEYAHGQGIVHRDIKPSNLLLDAHGAVWVTDFGLAKATDDDDLTHTGDIVGTVRYMAPERFREQCDARSDVYALGLTLYELLAFRPAFAGADRHDLIRRITQEEPPRLRALDSSIPRDLETVVQKAIERDPAHRYGSARALAEDLRRFLDDRPILARRSSRAERLARWARRNRALAVALSAVASLLVAVAVGSTIAAVLYQGKAEALRWRDYIHRIDRAYHEVLDGNIASAKDLLAGCPEDLHDYWEWRHVWRLCHLATKTFDGFPRDVLSLTYGPGGGWFAVGTGEKFRPAPGDDCEVLIKATSDGRVLGRWTGKGSVRSLAVSPDGGRIAIAIGSWIGGNHSAEGVNSELILWEWGADRVIARYSFERGLMSRRVAFARGGREVAVSYGGAQDRDFDPGGVRFFDEAGRFLRDRPWPGNNSVTALCYDPHGRRLAIAGSGSVEILDESGAVFRRLPETGPPFYAMDISPDGNVLAAGGWLRTITLWDLETGRELRRIYGHTGFVRDLAFSPDGRSLASVGEDRIVRLWDVETGTPLAALPGHESFVFAVAFHPDGRQIASGSEDRTVKLWDVPARLQPVHFVPGMGMGTIFGQFGYPAGLTFGPDSRTIGSGVHEYIFRTFAWIWDPRTGRTFRTLPEQDPKVGVEPRKGLDSTVVAFSPDLGHLAARKGEHTIEVWDTAEGRPVVTIPGHAARLSALAFTPDGRHLAAAEEDGTVSLWEVARATEIWSKKAHAGAAWCLAFDRDGSRVASAGEDGLRVLDAVHGTKFLEIAREPSQRIGGVAFHPREPLIAVGMHDAEDSISKPGIIGLYGLGTGRLVRSFRGHSGGVTDVAFNPDGTRLASASDDRTVKLWDTETGDAVLTLRGHTAGVLDVAFSPDGNLLATGGIDLAVRIWDARPLD